MATSGPNSAIGGGYEVPAVPSFEELPQLPDRVDYSTRLGHRRHVDIPIPEHLKHALPAGVQHVGFLLPLEFLISVFISFAFLWNILGLISFYL
ncbi:hypothetical protein RHSIM_Rhsim12G0012500 [Rhododendron simsii]|uniref:Uncharacterized protein n=1 Tax=Rhododendron simsii TaxID=118357 RepID=A0A834G8B4_RHOSS|nr:hypothetical protein RHSIM_Rhsim12G0012500 [Rhododendron simsii]